MVAARSALSNLATFTGVRPMDIMHDLGGIAEVLAESFRGEMDTAGGRAVREMRAIGRILGCDSLSHLGEARVP